MGTRPVPWHRLHGKGKGTSLFHDVRAALPWSGAAQRGRAGVSFARSPAKGGKDSFVGQENRPHPRARSFLSHINSGANTGTGIPPPCCPQGQGLTLMEGARWALAAGAGRGGRAASAAPAGGQRGSLRVTQRGGRNRTHPAGGAALPASRTRGQDGDPPRGTQRGPEG